MFKVTKKPKTPNIIWDTSGNRPLCRFVKGVFETNDAALAGRLKALGHTFEGEADEKPLDEMKVDDLRAYAAEHNIDLGEAKSKADLLKTIQEAEAKEQRR